MSRHVITDTFHAGVSSEVRLRLVLLSALLSLVLPRHASTASASSIASGSTTLGSMAMESSAPSTDTPTTDTPTAVPRTAAPSSSRAGVVAILSGDWSLPIETASALCPDPNARVWITVAAPSLADASASDANATGVNASRVNASRADASRTSAAGVDVLARLGSATPRVTLDRAHPHWGDDEALAKRVRASRCIVLEGGTWIDWWSALKPSHKLTSLGRAVVDAHASGATVIGVGAAGAYLAQRSLISRHALQRPARDPHDPSADLLAAGLDLAEDVCLDLAIDGRATAEAMIERLANSDVEIGVWLEGQAAWIQDGDARSAHVVTGDGRVLVFDLSHSVRSRGSLRDGRLALLDDGTGFDLRHHSFVPRADAAPTRAANVAWLPELASADRGEYRGALGRITFRRDASPANDAPTAARALATVGAFDWTFEPTNRESTNR